MKATIAQFAGLRIVQSDMAVQSVPTKAHKRRRNQSATYHRRVQKKWVRRFGMKTIPAAYAAAGGMVFVHPSIYAKLRGAL